PERRDIPLAVAEVVDEVALSLFFGYLKGLEEGVVGGADPQILVEDEEGLPQRRNDTLRIRERVLEVLLGPLACGHDSPAPERCRPAVPGPAPNIGEARPELKARAGS